MIKLQKSWNSWFLKHRSKQDVSFKFQFVWLFLWHRDKTNLVCYQSGCSNVVLQVLNLLLDLDPDFLIIGKRYINVLQVCCHLVAMSSACYNPFIYASLHSKVRMHLKGYLCPCHNHQRETVERPSSRSWAFTMTSATTPGMQTSSCIHRIHHDPSVMWLKEKKQLLNVLLNHFIFMLLQRFVTSRHCVFSQYSPEQLLDKDFYQGKGADLYQMVCWWEGPRWGHLFGSLWCSWTVKLLS